MLVLPIGFGLLRCAGRPGLTLLLMGYSRVVEPSFGGEAARKGM